MKSVDDLIESSGGGKPYIKLNYPGAKLVGELVDARVGVERDYDTGQPLTWDDGTPKQQLVLDIRIDWERSVGVTTGKGEEQAEVGTLYCKWLQQQAIAAACKAAGVKLSQVGPIALVRLEDGVPSNPKRKPPHQFAAEVARRTAAPGVDSLLSASEPAAPSAAAPAPGSLLGASEPATQPAAAPAPGSLLG